VPIRRLHSVARARGQLLEVLASLLVLTLAGQTDPCSDTVKNSSLADFLPVTSSDHAGGLALLQVILCMCIVGKKILKNDCVFFSRDISMQGGLAFSQHVSILFLVCQRAVTLQDLVFSWFCVAGYVNGHLLL